MAPPPVPIQTGNFYHNNQPWTSRPSSPSGHSNASSAGDSAIASMPLPPPPIRVETQGPVTPPIAAPASPKKRKSWFPSRKDTDLTAGPSAWIAGHDNKVPYSLVDLTSCRPVEELWDPTGDCYVYLFARNSGRGPSFRVHSSIFASSPELTRKAFGDLYNNPSAAGANAAPPLDSRLGQMSLQTPPATPRQQKRISSHLSEQSSLSSRSIRSAKSMTNLSDDRPQEVHLYLDTHFDEPMSPSTVEAALPDSTETLVSIRNFFAFLAGQSLIATARRTSLFSIFMRIAELLKRYGFTNMDSSTYGENACTSFDNYIHELGLADCRKSREKTIEGIILGERMRSVTLYNEAFTHGVGKHEDLMTLESKKFGLLSPITVNRLGRAALDLEKRTASIRHTLEDFEFPAIFSGTMNSKTVDERKVVNFDAWKDSFLSMRKFFIAYYKRSYGNWPPKASSKKNSLETSGLNRLVLRDLYHDLSALYDLIVDRTNLTTRTADGVHVDERLSDGPIVRAIRTVLSEYDRSSPPVKPPIPFDLPKLPTANIGSKASPAKPKKVKDDDLNSILRASYNADAAQDRSPFITAFREFEHKSARSSTIQDLVSLRMGQWLFMYAVLQALPMLVIDAPVLRHTLGVEYFLCEPPRSGVPWASREDSIHGRKQWFGIAGGGGVVSLPSDAIEHSVDAVYRRSHCWIMAAKWTTDDPQLWSPVSPNSAQNPSFPSLSIGLASPTRDSSLSSMMDSLPSLTAGSMSSSSRPTSTLVSRNSQTTLPVPQILGSPPLLAQPQIPGLSPHGKTRSRSASRTRRESSIMLGLEALPLPAGVHPESVMAGGGAGESLQARPGAAKARSRPVSRHEMDPSKTFDAILASAALDQKGGKKK